MPFLSNKGVNSSKITLVEKNSIVLDENKIANIMNKYFINSPGHTYRFIMNGIHY